MSCNFGLKSYLWFQIELALRARSILKSRVWFQTKLHSTQFNYHYKFRLIYTWWKIERSKITSLIFWKKPDFLKWKILASFKENKVTKWQKSYHNKARAKFLHDINSPIINSFDLHAARHWYRENGWKEYFRRPVVLCV